MPPTAPKTREAVEEESRRLVTDKALRPHVGYNMKRAFHALQQDLQMVLRPFGLRMITYSTLAIIEDNPGLRPSQLAECLAIERANLVVILDELENAGWITRTRSPEDRRAHALHLTETGCDVQRRAQEAVFDHDKRMRAGLTAREQKALITALRQIETNAREEKT